MSQLRSADITWQTDEHGNITPISTLFDDVYFSKTGGLAESEYVFLQGNRLPERFAALSDDGCFVIAETGFGTGLNFLVSCLLWSKTAPPTARLHFISTEKYPLSQSDLRTALSVWQDTDVGSFIDELLENYPLALTGCHRLHFCTFANITLDLWLGDALSSFAQMPMPKQGMADAWFLDGFAPTKNSELWSEAIFDQIKRLSKPHATLATFTSSGAVRRALQGIGMSVQKIKGFGRKREMITAHFLSDTQKPHPTPKTAVIIGAGVSGLLTAHALASRGVSVSLLDKTAPIAGASGNPKALFAPKLTQLSDAHDHLPTVSFLYSERVYRAFDNAFGGATSDGQIFNQTGVVDFLLPTQKSHDKLRHLTDSYPDELIYGFNENFDSDNDDFNRQRINTFLPKAGLIDTQLLAKFILSHPSITFKKYHVNAISTHHNHVIIDGDDQTLMADVAIICAGFESHLLHKRLFNPRKIRGQVSFLPLPQIPNQAFDKFATLKTPIKYDGYCARFLQDTTPMLLLGASFVRNDTSTAITDDEHRFNVDKFTQSLPNIAQQLNIDTAKLQGRASIRAQTPDYHPLVGQIDERIYTLYGMGSKGFGFAPFCAQVLAGLIFDEPLPISVALFDKISPNRPRLQTPLNHNQ